MEKVNRLEYSKEEVIKLISEFFFTGMTYEEFGNGKKLGGPCIPRNMSCGEYLYKKMRENKTLNKNE